MSFWMTSRRPVARVRSAIELFIVLRLNGKRVYSKPAYRLFLINYPLNTTVFNPWLGFEEWEQKGHIQQVDFRPSML